LSLKLGGVWEGPANELRRGRRRRRRRALNQVNYDTLNFES